MVRWCNGAMVQRCDGASGTEAYQSRRLRPPADARAGGRGTLIHSTLAAARPKDLAVATADEKPSPRARRRPLASPCDSRWHPRRSISTDVWVFACVLFETLTGKRGFDAGYVSPTLTRTACQAHRGWGMRITSGDRVVAMTRCPARRRYTI